ncbi:Peptidase family U32 [Candidatus Gugararchaeum adminiculabundum]|nr:Peptidase family U32 [Candidatus Gugararchaeum adminiculabundum]
MITMALELLAPAGSPAALKAAVEAGADSVYLGSAWNARMRARNFTKEELASALAYCRKEKVKSYITLNTLIFEQELAGVADHIKFIYENGADSLIIQDLGVAAIAREIAPNLKLHASTQMSVHNSKTAEKLKKIGFKRIVLARELSLEQAAKIKENSGIEIESFCHGALCYSYSGKCLLSYYQTGRSGNRGACAQLCRLPWKLFCKGKQIPEINGHLTSTKDLNTLEKIPEIAKAGIDCVKIEGRLRDAAYLRTIVKAYRRAIDTSQITDLSKFTSRSYTGGYLFGAARKSRLTSPAAPSFSGTKIGEVIETSRKGAEVRLTAALAVGDSIRASSSNKIIEIFRIYKNEKEVPVGTGNCILKIKSFRRGDTLFKVERAEIEDDFLKRIKPSRIRSALPFKPKEKIVFPITNSASKETRFIFPEHPREISSLSSGSFCVINWEDATEESLAAAKEKGVKLIIETPRIIFDEELPGVEARMKELEQSEGSASSPFAFSVSDPSLASNYPTIVSTYANVCNTLAANEWRNFGNIQGVIASIEVPKKVSPELGFIPFAGKSVELMISENNLFKELNIPESQMDGCELVDPNGNHFPFRLRNGRTVILSPKK